MAKYMTRTFRYSRVEIAVVDFVGDEIRYNDVLPVVVMGEISKEQAKKIVAKKYPGDNIVIKEIYVQEELRGMPVEKFVQASVLMANPNETMEEFEARKEEK